MNKINKSQIKDLANLYDIKTLSQAIADKGWACLSKEGNFLSQAQAPTLYNDMVAKLDSADKDWSSIQTGEEYSFAFDKAVVIFNNKIYTINSSQLYVADSPTDSPEVLDNTTTYSKFICVGKNILVCAIANNKYRVFDKEGNHKDIDEVAGLTSLDYVGGGNENGTARRLFIEGNYIYAFFTGTKIYKIVDDYDNISITEITLDTTVNDMYQDTTNGKIYKFQNNTSNKGELYVADSVEGEYTLIKTFSFGIGGANACVVAEGNFILVLVRSGIDKGIWTTDNWTTTNTTSGYIFTDTRDYFKPFVKNGYVYDFQYSSSVTYKRSITDLDNATSLPYAFITYNDNLMLFIYDDRRIDYSETENKVYTDTFVINGNTVTIDYAKAQDGTKIVTEFSQITPMQTIGNYLGYSNYFFLSQAPGYEGVNLPYNSNLWTYMYVGDDYVETNIPSGNYIPFALKTDLDILPSQEGNNGKFLTTNGSTLSWAEVQGGGGTSIISTINTAVAPDTTVVNTGTDLSDDTILGVYINGLYQIDSSDYTMSTSGGESTIELATTYSTTIALNVVYATSVDIADLSYNDLSNKPSINGVTLSGDISLSSLGIQSQNLSFMNIEASTWSVSEAYPDYAYECSLTCTGVTTNSFAQVVFSPEDAASGNYANICTTSTNSVTIYGKVDTIITIPTIIVMGV